MLNFECRMVNNESRSANMLTSYHPDVRRDDNCEVIHFTFDVSRLTFDVSRFTHLTKSSLSHYPPCTLVFPA
jgi:hypothetical protein